MHERLKYIADEIDEILNAGTIDSLAIESAFFAKNASTAFKLGQVRGVCMLGAARAGLPVHEYAPRLVKVAVSGYGAAGKQQVAWMVQRILKLDSPIESPDAADALAIAICHAHHAWHNGSLTMESSL